MAFLLLHNYTDFINSSSDIFNLSRMFMSLIQEISDSPRSNLEICDLERFSSAILQILLCFP